MKLTFRDLKQQKFTIEAEPSETIAQVKEKIHNEKGWESSQQKLIYSGKILADANTVESYNIEEKGFIVCMVSKPKAAPATSSSTATPSTPAPAQSSTPAPPPAPQAAPAATANAPATPSPAPAAGATTSPTQQENATFNDPSALLVGQQGEGVVVQMEAMGFARSEIDRAMRAAFFNPDRAVEYLLNGIPENIQTEQRQGQQRGTPGAAAASPAPASGNTPAAAAPSSNPDEPVNLFEAAAQAGTGGTTGARTGGARSPAAGLAGAGAGAAAAAGAGGQVNMDFLRTNPHFQQLRQLVQQSPAMLEPILQQVAEGNPQLAQMIGQNQDQFLQLLSEDLEQGEGQGGVPPGATTISVTEEERDAIERLCRLGFPRDAVVQAYFACDKNEELAANYLFDQPDDDEAQ